MEVPTEDDLVLAGGLNGHVGQQTEGYDGVQGGHGYGLRNDEGESSLVLSQWCAMQAIMLAGYYGYILQHEPRASTQTATHVGCSSITHKYCNMD